MTYEGLPRIFTYRLPGNLWTLRDSEKAWNATGLGSCPLLRFNCLSNPPRSCSLPALTWLCVCLSVCTRRAVSWSWSGPGRGRVARPWSCLHRRRRCRRRPRRPRSAVRRCRRRPANPASIWTIWSRWRWSLTMRRAGMT